MPVMTPPNSCKTCGEVTWSPHHKCPPKWSVWNPDQEEEEDARVIFAPDAEEAAALWGERDDNDSAEYDIAKGHPAVVHVRPYPDGKEVFKFKVQGEYEPHYWADAVE